MNQVNIIGRLASDTIIYETATTHRSVIRSAIAVDSRVKHTNGEKITSFFEIEAWDDIGKRIVENVSKGDKIAITGRLEQQKFTLKDGRKSQKVVIVISSVEYLTPKKQESEMNIEELPDDTIVQEDDLPF